MKSDESYIEYKTIFENTGNATILIEEDMTISAVNSELERISGYIKTEIEGIMKFPELIAEEDRQIVIRNHRLRRKAPEKAPGNYPCRVLVRNGRVKECIVTVALINGTQKSVASITDISEHKRLEREVARISMEERLRLGRNLHDDLGSHLAGVEAMCALLSGRLTKQNNPEQELAKEITELVNSAISKTRNLVQGLMPVNFEKSGFKPALEGYCREVERAFGITCHIVENSTIPKTDAAVSVHIYYIIRESVNNAVKHGKAENIEIIFYSDKTSEHVEIRDDGIGLSGTNNEEKGVGHTIMQQRADLINADLEITENTGGGTRIRCNIKRKS